MTMLLESCEAQLVESGDGNNATTTENNIQMLNCAANSLQSGLDVFFLLFSVSLEMRCAARDGCDVMRTGILS
jgi:hypothetical protein